MEDSPFPVRRVSNREAGTRRTSLVVLPSVHVRRAGTLAMEPRGLAEHGDDLAELPEGDPVVACGAGLGQLATAAGQLGPVDRPGLLDRQLPGLLGQLGECLDQVLVDFTNFRPITMFV